ncbi:MAG: SH3 domain-containing protein, partial [Chloroflexi bacterium]|nr:SH3 domain-containing protein [Chloroflexota bacterium]
MQRKNIIGWGVIASLVLAFFLGAGDFRAVAQGPDGWTAYELNLRAGPGGSYEVLAILPVNTGLVFEAHNGDLNWLLGQTEDGTWRGWVASGYLSYRDGFAAAALPVSSEVVTAPPSDAEAAGSAPAPTNGAIIAQELVYETDRSQYYRITYWSDGLRVNGFLGMPTLGGSHPAVIYNRGGAWDTGRLTGLEIVPLVESGYVAVASQYRGNAGSDGWEQFGGGEVN